MASIVDVTTLLKDDPNKYDDGAEYVIGYCTKRLEVFLGIDLTDYITIDLIELISTISKPLITPSFLYIYETAFFRPGTVMEDVRATVFTLVVVTKALQI